MLSVIIDNCIVSKLNYGARPISLEKKMNRNFDSSGYRVVTKGNRREDQRLIGQLLNGEIKIEDI
jgi:hypothetical protein